MSFFNKKKVGHYNVLTDKYVPASLPSYGQGLETFVPADYPMNKPEVVEAAYHDVKNHLDDVIATCDRHCVGTECDHYIDAETEHSYAVHEAAVANNENQIVRIRSAREMRKADLDRKIGLLEEKAAKLKSEIEPLEGLRPQFQVRIGSFTISLGLPITIAAMVVDAAVNYGALQSVLLSNATLLMITVIAMSLMSDASMWVLGTFLSHRGEKFVSKSLFWTICAGLAGMFSISVVASVMVRFGSMDSTFGTINAAGEFVGKEAYSLAEYGVTLTSAFLTTATGLISFGFSLDENAFLVSVRENKEKELTKCLAELDPLLNERTLLVNAPDPQAWDEHKRAAAVHQIEATRLGLKLHCRKQMTVRVNDPDFTERMAEAGATLFGDASPASVSTIPAAVTLTKAS